MISITTLIRYSGFLLAKFVSKNESIKELILASAPCLLASYIVSSVFFDPKISAGLIISLISSWFFGNLLFPLVFGWATYVLVSMIIW